jgi:hypothetical protein
MKKLPIGIAVIAALVTTNYHASIANAQQGTNAPLKPAQLQGQFHSVARGVHVYCPGNTPSKYCKPPAQTAPTNTKPSKTKAHSGTVITAPSKF